VNVVREQELKRKRWREQRSQVVLQCVNGLAVCCSVLQCVAVCCRVLQCVVMGVFQRVVVCRKWANVANGANGARAAAKETRRERPSIQCCALQHIAPHSRPHTATYCNTPATTLCNTLRLHQTARQCNTLQRTATHCNTLQHTATHCNTLQQYLM